MRAGMASSRLTHCIIRRARLLFILSVTFWREADCSTSSFPRLYSKLLTAMTHKYATMSFLKKYQITISLETKKKLGRYLSSPIWRAFCVRRWHISASSSRWFGHHQIDFHSCNTIRATPFDDTFNYVWTYSSSYGSIAQIWRTDTW